MVVDESESSDVDNGDTFKCHRRFKVSLVVSYAITFIMLATSREQVEKTLIKN